MKDLEKIIQHFGDIQLLYHEVYNKPGTFVYCIMGDKISITSSDLATCINGLLLYIDGGFENGKEI